MSNSRHIIFTLILFMIACSFLVNPERAAAAGSAFDQHADRAIRSYIKQTGGDVTLVYHDLVTGAEYTIRPNQPRRAASTIKLPLVMYVMARASAHQLDLNQQLTYRGSDYTAGSGVIQYRPVGSRYSIRELIQKAVVYSDNIAFVMLKNYVGRENFNGYIRQIGGKYAYPGGANLTSARDLTTYIVKLYHDAKQDGNARTLIDLLEHTKYNETIPAGVKWSPVAHKAGWMPNVGVSNDVAIVYDRYPYTLAIMTGGYAYETAKIVIAHLAELTDEYHRRDYSMRNRFFPATGRGGPRAF
ncbi:MAG: class A beta-lactamase-related serine hydrolase [Sporolactobacillus sp.]|nr:class A beta-lactamase-related serine hydrolase [Sporolactobacillus sp.]